MCYQTKLTKKASEIEFRFNAVFDDLNLFESSNEINAFDFPKTPIISNQEKHKIKYYQWGLIPKWARDESIKKFNLNARIETISKKPSFKAAINNRCLIIVNGFYEWQWLNASGNKKQKYEIGLPNKELFSLAGLWSEWYHVEFQKWIKTYTVVTTQARGLMEKIHNSKKRMPILLNKEEEALWLSDKEVDYFKNLKPDLVAHKIMPDNLNSSQLKIF